MGADLLSASRGSLRCLALPVVWGVHGASQTEGLKRTTHAPFPLFPHNTYQRPPCRPFTFAEGREGDTYLLACCDDGGGATVRTSQAQSL